MSFGVAFRNAVSIGLGGIISMLSSSGTMVFVESFLLCENNDFLVQEDGGFILLE
jgi:hypothetical protein